MKRLNLLLFCLAGLTGQALALKPAEVNIATDPGVTVNITKRAGNTSKTVFVTINKQDRVTVNGKQVYPPLPPTPPPVPTPPPLVITPPAPPGMLLFKEGELFTLAGAAAVSYGDESRRVTRNLPAGRHGCSSFLFGDPAVGARKHCLVPINPASPPPVVVPPPPPPPVVVPPPPPPPVVVPPPPVVVPPPPPPVVPPVVPPPPGGGTATLSWGPPSLRSDGSPMLSLGGFIVVASPAGIPATGAVCATCVEVRLEPATTGLDLRDLDRSRTWTFAVIALDDRGVREAASERVTAPFGPDGVIRAHLPFGLGLPGHYQVAALDPRNPVNSAAWSSEYRTSLVTSSPTWAQTTGDLATMRPTSAAGVGHPCDCRTNALVAADGRAVCSVPNVFTMTNWIQISGDDLWRLGLFKHQSPPQYTYCEPRVFTSTGVNFNTLAGPPPTPLPRSKCGPTMGAVQAPCPEDEVK